MTRYKFLTSCVNTKGDDINEMQAVAKEVTRGTFLQYVDRASLADLTDALGYERYPRAGLTMAGDWHVSYYRSIYRGQPCVYFVHSCIEYIFTP